MPPDFMHWVSDPAHHEAAFYLRDSMAAFLRIGPTVADGILQGRSDEN